MKSLTLTLLLAVILTGALLAGTKETTTLRVLVQNEEGSPVARASLIVKTLKGKKLDKVDETFQLRTSQQGSVPLPPLKQGFALIQVIAEGYQTYGERIELTEPEQTVVVTLKPPQDQFSVHKK